MSNMTLGNEYASRVKDNPYSPALSRTEMDSNVIEGIKIWYNAYANPGNYPEIGTYKPTLEEAREKMRILVEKHQDRLRANNLGDISTRVKLAIQTYANKLLALQNKPTPEENGNGNGNGNGNMTPLLIGGAIIAGFFLL